MSSSNIYKSKGIQISSIRPYDFTQDNDFTGSVIVASRHAKDTRRFSQDKAVGSAVPDNKGQEIDSADTAGSIFKQPASFWEEAEKKLNRTTQALGSTLAEISRLRETILTNSTNDMLRLVMAISKQVIGQEVAAREDLIVSIITQALHASIKADEFHIKINPDDLLVVNEKKPLFLASISGLKNITIEADPSIARGGCLVESALGQVDATIDIKLEKIYQELQGLTEK
jgi:flagellar biosynthesis/type III secretory pathway protein FliH